MKFLWVFDHDAVWVLGPLTSALFAFGGSGEKWLRRIGIPVLFFLAGISTGLSIISCLISGLLLWAFLSLGYGKTIHDKTGKLYWIYIFCLGLLISGSLVPLYLASGRPLLFLYSFGVFACTFAGLTFCSQRLDFPKWKFVEMASGLVLGFQAALILS